MSNKTLNIDFDTFLTLIKNTCEANVSNSNNPFLSSNKIEWFVKQFDEVNITYKKEVEDESNK